MNFKKNWKRFCDLSSAREGFTLVELIVVIAILAILAGVAVPAYSGYVKKANKGADQTLVGEVMHALTLYYYAHPEEVTSGYVVLTPEGEVCGYDEVGLAAMDAVFGDNWENTVGLKYDGWTDDGVLNNVLADENVQYVADSNFIQNYTPTELVSAVSGVTDALVDTILGAGKNPVEKLGDLNLLSDTQLNDIEEELADMEVAWVQGGDNTAYSNALSNLLVKYVADEYKATDLENYTEQEPDGLAGMALNYALVYAWAASSEDGQEVLDGMNAAMIDPDTGSEELIQAFMDGMEKALADDIYNESMYETDYMAVYSIMGTVSDISKDFDMSAEGLYSSDSISSLVNNYTGAVIAVSALTPERRQALANRAAGTIVIFITEDGTAVSVPDITE